MKTTLGAMVAFALGVPIKGDTYTESVPSQKSVTRFVASVRDPIASVSTQSFGMPTAAKPSCTLTANPVVITIGQSSTLSWSSSNTFQASINGGIGPVSTSGSMYITPSSFTYTLTVTGGGGSANCSTSVTVAAPVPTSQPSCAISANPTVIKAGESTTLSWISTNASQTALNGGIGSVPQSGSLKITPSTFTFVLTASGSGGAGSCSADVVANP